MARTLVEEYPDVVRGIRAFNASLEKGEGLDTHLSYFKHWYYAPELDKVGPSKFVGYLDLTPEESMSGLDLDGRTTEARLKRWFSIQIEGTYESNYVIKLVTELLKEHGKIPNYLVRAHTPKNWSLSD